MAAWHTAHVLLQSPGWPIQPGSEWIIRRVPANNNTATEPHGYSTWRVTLGDGVLDRGPAGQRWARCGCIGNPCVGYKQARAHLLMTPPCVGVLMGPKDRTGVPTGVEARMESSSKSSSPSASSCCTASSGLFDMAASKEDVSDVTDVRG